MNEKIRTGRRGEEEAAAHLRKNGYRILGRNVRTRLGEIDIVAKDKHVVCFVEVRSRRGEMKHAEALESIGPAKQRRLSRLAAQYLKENDLWGRSARFDIVSVCDSSIEGTLSVVLLKDAFAVDGRYS